MVVIILLGGRGGGFGRQGLDSLNWIFLLLLDGDGFARGHGCIGGEAIGLSNCLRRKRCLGRLTIALSKLSQ